MMIEDKIKQLQSQYKPILSKLDVHRIYYTSFKDVTAKYGTSVEMAYCTFAGQSSTQDLFDFMAYKDNLTARLTSARCLKLYNQRSDSNGSK